MSTNPAANPTVKANVQSCTISDNSCAGSGGALFLRDVRTTIVGGFMSANSAGLSANASGGGVHFHATAAYAFAATSLDMQKVTLNSNSAAVGGAIHLLKDSTRRVGVACFECKLTDNKIIGVGPGSAVTTLDRSQGGEQLTVDLTDTVWAGGWRPTALGCVEWAHLDYRTPLATLQASMCLVRACRGQPLPPSIQVECTHSGAAVGMVDAHAADNLFRGACPTRAMHPFPQPQARATCPDCRTSPPALHPLHPCCRREQGRRCLRPGRPAASDSCEREGCVRHAGGIVLCLRPGHLQPLLPEHLVMTGQPWSTTPAARHGQRHVHFIH